MTDPTGEAHTSALRLDFDRRLLLQFRGSTITSDAGLLAYRELDDALHLTDTAANTLADARTGKNGRHRLSRAAAPISVRACTACGFWDTGLKPTPPERAVEAAVCDIQPG